MDLSEDYVGVELDEPYATIVLAVKSPELLQRYMDYIYEEDPGCPVFWASSLDSVDAFYRALLPEKLTFVIADSVARDAANTYSTLHAQTIEARILNDIQQGSPVRMVRIRDTASFEQSVMEAVENDRVFSRYTLHMPRPAAVA